MTIQRYSVCDGWPMAGLEANDVGRVVLYADHLAAMQRADEDYKNVEAVANLAISLANEFEIAVASREPRSGMSVPPSGDFISCAQLPSAVGRMKWWAREIRKAQERWRA